MANDDRKLQPLQQRMRIVNADGTPNEYFIRWAQQRQIDILEAITPAQAMQLIEDWSAARSVIAGAGLDGGGTLNANITIDANASDILDLIDDTQGAILFRGAAGWEVLLPGTDGQVLTTTGPLADPVWQSEVLDVEEEGVNVVKTDTLNFVGTGVTVTDVGGVATVTISGGGGGSAPFAPWTVPLVADFTQVNITTATFADNLDGIAAIIPGGASFQVRGLLQAAPTTPWSAYCHIDPQPVGRNSNSRIGISCRNTGTGRLSQFGWMTFSDGSLRASILHWNSTTSYSSDSTSDARGPGAQWLRLENDGTDLNLYVGDGYSWILIRTETLASWLGFVDEVGVMWQIDVSSILKINSWSLTAPAAGGGGPAA